MGNCCAQSHVKNGTIEVPLVEDSKRVPIPKKIRQAVWVKYHSDSNAGVCYCCGTEIQRLNKGWHCAHVLAYAKGGENTVENLRAACRTCNLSMGDQNLYTYIQVKGLMGPGAVNAANYLKRHPSQEQDVRTNNWGKSSKSSNKKIVNKVSRSKKGTKKGTKH